MAAKKCTPEVNHKRCKGCGICVTFCPKKVFGANFEGKALVERAEDCVGCKACETRCPDFAITLHFEE